LAGRPRRPRYHRQPLNFHPPPFARRVRAALAEIADRPITSVPSGLGLGGPRARREGDERPMYDCVLCAALPFEPEPTYGYGRGRVASMGRSPADRNASTSLRPSSGRGAPSRLGSRLLIVRPPRFAARSEVNPSGSWAGFRRRRAFAGACANRSGPILAHVCRTLPPIYEARCGPWRRVGPEPPTIVLGEAAKIFRVPRRPMRALPPPPGTVNALNLPSPASRMGRPPTRSRLVEEQLKYLIRSPRSCLAQPYPRRARDFPEKTAEGLRARARSARGRPGGDRKGTARHLPRRPASRRLSRLR